MTLQEDREEHGIPRKEVFDNKSGLTYAWWGGHQVSIYNSAGDEIDVLNAGDFSKDSASSADIARSIKERIRDNERESEGLEEGRCSEGYHWVRAHESYAGGYVRGHCARDPRKR